MMYVKTSAVRLGARMKKLKRKKSSNVIQEFLTHLKLSTQSFLSGLRLGRSKHLLAISWKSPKFLVGTMTVTLLIGGAIVYFGGTASAAYLVVNGQKIGIVESVDKGQKLVEGILTERGLSTGKVAKTHDLLVYEPVRVKKVELLDGVSIDNDLQKVLTSYIDGYALEIEGTQVAILPSQEDVQTLLKSYQDFYTKPSDNNQVISVEFSESIVTTPVEAQPDQVIALDQALKELTDGRITTTEYTAQEKDSLWQIARNNDMLTKEVISGNPGMTEDSIIKPGQKLNIVTVSPYLTVISEGTLTSTETIPYDVVTNTDTKLASGKTVVKEPGSEGSKVVTYSYTQKNGKNLSKQVVEEKVIKKPVTQVVSKGPAPVSIASNVSRGTNISIGIAWPLRGPINSPFGSRWGGVHTGLDIGGKTGTPYYAAAAGKVISAGWGGGYGYVLLIDHGNGIRTRYAHSSKLLVSVGQQVQQGQNIGLVGSTGNSTGSHLHFEVIKNGTPVNPMNYLK